MRTGLLVWAAILLAPSCYTNATYESDEPETKRRSGEIGVELRLGSVAIDRIDWTLTNSRPVPPAGFEGPMHGTFDVRGSGSTFAGLIPGIPEGDGYDLAFAANSVDMTRVCTGHAQPTPFSVTSAATSSASVHLSCIDTRPRAGDGE